MRDIRKAIDELRSTLCAQLCAVHLAPYSVHMVSDIDGGLALTGKSFDRESIVRTVLTRVRLYKAVLRADSPDYRLFAGLEQSLAHILTKEADEMMGEIDVVLNDDYAVLHVGDLRFYYGYEVTTAGERGFDLDDAEDAEWCFQVTRGKKVLMTIPCNELAAADETGEPAEMLLIGIGMWIVAQQKKEDAE